MFIKRVTGNTHYFVTINDAIVQSHQRLNYYEKLAGKVALFDGRRPTKIVM